ncbi:MAG TPA: hypothetical protein ENI42_03175, partial [Thermoplasmatales archaeon]|nr:hypothetical protein [Thermoplasmatales archaeon]
MMKHKLLFELSEEHPTLPFSEIKACLTGEKKVFKIVDSDDAFLVVETSFSQDLIKSLEKRISLSYFIN